MVPPMAPPQVPPGAQQSSNPFGWTGIKREKYTRWHGKLDGRQKIISRMISEGVRFNLKNWGVVALVILSWVFSMLFPVLSAGMGGMQLETENPSTYSGNEATLVSMHQNITNASVAEYPLVGANLTPMTEMSTMNVPMGWSAYFNTTPSGSGVKPSLVVIPPAEMSGPGFAAIRVVAVTGRRTDTFSTVTMVVPSPMMTVHQYSYEMQFTKDTFRGKAGETVKTSFYINNTGTVEDTYNITFTGMASKWKTSAFVNDIKVDIKTRTVGGGDGREFFQIKEKYFKMTVGPGSSAICVLQFRTATDSPKATAISVRVASNNDDVVAGSYITSVRLTDTKKMDLTGSIFLNSVMGTMTIWALLLAAVVGSRMIATDLAEKSYNLYFARPLTKRDYLIGKFGTVGSILALVTLVPSLITYVLLLVLTTNSNTYFVDHLWVWGAIIGYSLVMIITLSTLSMAFSALTSRRFYAAAAVVVIFMITSIMGSIATFAFNSDYGRLIGLPDDISLIGQVAFNQMEGVTLKFPWYYSLGVLAVVWVMCTFLVWYKVERTELSE